MEPRSPSHVRAVLAAMVSRSRDRAAFWKGVPAWARAAFLGGVFCSFMVMGFVTDIFAIGSSPAPRLAFLVFSSGLLAVIYAVSAVRSARLLAVAVAAHVSFTVLLNAYWPPMPLPLTLDAAGLEALHARFTLDGVGCIVGMVLSYACFVTFISTEGQRYLRVHHEMVLAERIHRSLVPSVDAVVGAFEFHGQSFPSGEVGGDLVDVVRTPDGWIALVADVSGHGVRSGVLTAMVKSAARMRLRAPGEVSALLADLNETLVPMIDANMFVTCTCLAGGASRMVTLAAAGHPPALHYRHRTGDVVEHNTQNLALGIFPAQPYASVRLDLDAGDVLVLLTDGLLEVFDRKDAEFGLGGFARVLREHAREPLSAVATRIRDAALAHGPQTDDQTLLLIRAR